MPYDNRGLTDEWSDYGLTRRMLGGAAVIGFGALSGVGIMRLNNSAFIRSLSKQMENPLWKWHTGSIISSGTALSKSELIKRSIMNTATLGVAESDRLKWQQHMANSFEHSRTGFLDQVLARADAITKERETYQKSLIDKMGTMAGRENDVLMRRLPEEDVISFFKTRFQDIIHTDSLLLSKNMPQYSISKESLSMLLQRVETKIGNESGKPYKELARRVFNIAKRTGFDKYSKGVKDTRISKLLQKLTTQSYAGGKNVSGLQSLIHQLESYIGSNPKLSAYREPLQNALSTMGDLRQSGQSPLDEFSKIRRAVSNASSFDDVMTELRKSSILASELSLDFTAEPTRIFASSHMVNPIINNSKMSDIITKIPTAVDKYEQARIAMQELSEKVRELTFTGEIKPNEHNILYQSASVMEDYVGGNARFQDIASAMEDLEYAVQKHNPALAKEINAVYTSIGEVEGDFFDLLDKTEDAVSGTKYAKAFSRRVEQIAGTDEHVVNMTINEELQQLTQISKMYIDDKIDELRTVHGQEITDQQSKAVRKLRQYNAKLRNVSTTEEVLRPSKQQIRSNAVKWEAAVDTAIRTQDRALAVSRWNKPKPWKPTVLKSTASLERSFQTATEALVERARTIGSSGTNFVIDAYARASEKVFNPAKPGVFNILLGAENPLNSFSETLVGKRNPRVKKLQEAIKSAFGASDVRASFRTVENGTVSELIFDPIVKNAQGIATSIPEGRIKLTMPTMAGNIMFKGREAYAMPSIIVDRSSGVVRAKSALAYYIDNAYDTILEQKNRGLKLSLENTEAIDAIREVNKRIENVHGGIFGRSGTPGLGRALNRASYTEALKLSTQFQDIKLFRQTSGMHKNSIKRRIMLKQAEYHVAQDSGEATSRELLRIRTDIEMLRRRLKQSGNAFQASSKFIEDMASARSVQITDLPAYTVDQLYEYTNGAVQFSLTGTSAVSLNRGTVGMLEGVRHQVVPDASRNMKAFMNIEDPLSMTLTKFSLEHSGYQLGSGLSFSEQYTIKTLRELGINKKMRSPLYKRLREFQTEVKVLQSTLNNMEKMGRDTALNLIKNDKLRANVGNIVNPAYTKKEMHDVLIKKKHELRIINKVYGLLDHPEALDPILAKRMPLSENVRKRVNEITTKMFGKNIDAIQGRTSHIRPTTAMLTSDAINMLSLSGLMQKRTDGSLVSMGAANMVNQLKVFQVDYPLGAEGVTFFSETGAKKLGWRIAREEKNVTDMAKLMGAFDSAMSKGDIDPRHAAAARKILDKIKSTIETNPNSNVLSLEEISKTIGNPKEFESFFKTMTQALNSNDPAVKLLKRGALQQSMISEGNAAAQLVGLGFEGDRVILKYNYMMGLASGSKVIGETTDKYVVNAILRDHDFLRMQRGLAIKSFSRLSGEASPMMKQFLSRFESSGKMMAGHRDWSEFLRTLGKTSPYYSAFKNITVADMFGTAKRQMRQGSGATSAGVLRSIFDQILDLRLTNKGPSVRSAIYTETNHKKQRLFEDIFGDILKTFTRDYVEFGSAPERFATYSKNKMPTKVALIKDKHFGTVFASSEANLGHLYKMLRTIEGNSTDAIYSSQMRSQISEAIKTRLRDDKYQGTFDGPTKAALYRQMMTKINRMLVLADKTHHRALGFVEGIQNIAPVTQNIFELTRTTKKGNYSILKGFSKGARLSPYDMMTIKLMGMPYTGQKMLEQSKHGSNYIQHYMGTMLQMMGVDPNNYYDQVNTTRSDAIKDAIANQKITLAMQKEYRSTAYNNITELRKQPTFEGLLDLSASEKRVLEKGVVPQSMTDRIENVIIETAGPNQVSRDKALEANVKLKTDQIYKEIEFKNYAKYTKEAERNLYLKSVSKLTIDDVIDYQNLLKKYKSVSFGVDPNKPSYMLHLNALRDKQIKGITLAPFGDRYYSRNDIEAMAAKRMPNRADDISTITDAFVTGKRQPVVTLNKVHRSQLAMLRAIHNGAPVDTLEFLSNNWFNSLAEYNQSIVRSTLKRGLGATVSGIGTGSTMVRYDRANVWAMVSDINSELKLGIDASSIAGATEKDLKNILHSSLARKGIDPESAQVQNVVKKVLSSPKGRPYFANPGQTVMSVKTFTEALDSVVSKSADAETIARDVIQGKRNWMALGLRFPTMRETNTMPLSVSLFDHQVLQKLGIGGDKLSSKLGLKEGTFMVSAIDSKLFGGDFDRDMYMAVLAVDDLFTKEGHELRNVEQNEMRNLFRKQMSYEYQMKTANGEQYAIVSTAEGSGTGVRAKNIFGKISNEIDDMVEKKMKYNAGISKSAAIMEVLREKKLDIAKIKSGNEIYIKGRALDMIRGSIEFDRFNSGDMGKVGDNLSNKGRAVFFMNGTEAADLHERMVAATIEQTPIGKFSDKELAKMATHKKVNLNAMMNSTTEQAKDRIKSLRRIMETEGYSSASINQYVDDAKQMWADMSTKKFNKYLKKLAPGQKFGTILEKQYRQSLVEMTGSLMAVKTLTGEVHNVGKYLIGNMAMTIFGEKDPDKALKIMSWVGELSDANVLSKHKIPVITSDVIKTVKTAIDPKAGDYDVAKAMFKLKNTEFNVTMTRKELRDIYRTESVVRKHLSKVNVEEAKGAAEDFIGMMKDIRSSSGGPFPQVTNLQYEKYLKARQSMSKSSLLSRAIGITREDALATEEGLAGIARSKKMIGDLGMELVQNRGSFIEAMKVSGAKNLRELMDFQSWVQNFTTAPEKIPEAITRMRNSNITLNRVVANILFPKIDRTYAKAAGPALFSAEPAMYSLSQRAAQKIEKKVSQSSLSRFVDADSFRGTSLGALVGMAAIGFVGAFAVSSNRREWLGPTAGFGGEYAERQTRKDEDRARGKSVTEIMQKNDVLTGGLHYKQPNPARLMGTGIKYKSSRTPVEIIRELNNPDMIDSPRQFYRF